MLLTATTQVPAQSPEAVPYYGDGTVMVRSTDWFAGRLLTKLQQQSAATLPFGRDGHWRATQVQTSQQPSARVEGHPYKQGVGVLRC
jgi:hypothetical protein